MGDARAGDHIANAFQQHRKANGADVLIMPAGELLGGENRARFWSRDEDPRNHLIWPERIVPIAEQEILNRHFPRPIRPCQRNPRAKRQQRRQRITNRARSTQIAAKRAERAYLARPQPAQQPGKSREIRIIRDLIKQRGIGFRRTDRKPLWPRANPTQFRNIAQANNGARVFPMLRKPQAEIRPARQNPRPRVFAPEPQRFSQAARQEKAMLRRAEGGDISRGA